MAELVCAVCLYDESGDPAEPALTVIEGYAVCEDHLGFVAQGMTFHGLNNLIRKLNRPLRERGLAGFEIEELFREALKVDGTP